MRITDLVYNSVWEHTSGTEVYIVKVSPDLNIIELEHKNINASSFYMSFDRFIDSFKERKEELCPSLRC